MIGVGSRAERNSGSDGLLNAIGQIRQSQGGQQGIDGFLPAGARRRAQLVQKSIARGFDLRVAGLRGADQIIDPTFQALLRLLLALELLLPALPLPLDIPMQRLCFHRLAPLPRPRPRPPAAFSFLQTSKTSASRQAFLSVCLSVVASLSPLLPFSPTLSPSPPPSPAFRPRRLATHPLIHAVLSSNCVAPLRPCSPTTVLPWWSRRPRRPWSGWPDLRCSPSNSVPRKGPNAVLCESEGYCIQPDPRLVRAIPILDRSHYRIVSCFWVEKRVYGKARADR